MDIRTNILPETPEASLMSSRSPLLSRSTSPTPTKQIRRKSSFFIRADSSEDAPSAHSSIYEAFCFSNNSIESLQKAEWLQVDALKGRKVFATIENDENCRDISGFRPSNSNQRFRYGNGTALETITEQKSNSTMRSLARTKSAENIQTIPFLNHRDSFIISKSPRKRRSFSMDDLDSIKQSYHDINTNMERSAHQSLQIHEIYAQPKSPILAPLKRPATPPGMPSWTAIQNNPRLRICNSPTPNRIQRFFGIQPSGITLSSRIPSAGLTSAGELSRISRPIPRYRPPRSVYGSLTQHPFNNAPIAKVDPFPNPLPTSSSASEPQRTFRIPKPTGKQKPGQQVRFTHSTTTRDPEEANIRNAVEAPTSSAAYPLSPIQEAPQYSPQPIAHCSPDPKRPKQCPHRKGRRASLKALNQQHTNPPSNDYTMMPTMSPPCQSSIASPSPPFTRSNSIRPLSSMVSLTSRPESVSSNMHELGQIEPVQSNTSTAPLMSVANPPTPSTSTHPNGTATDTTNKQKEIVCWKCRIERVFEKVDNFWKRSTHFLCFICCGFDTNDDMTLGPSSEYGVFGGYRGGNEMNAPRRVILEQTPVAL